LLISVPELNMDAGWIDDFLPSSPVWEDQILGIDEKVTSNILGDPFNDEELDTKMSCSSPESMTDSHLVDYTMRIMESYMKGKFSRQSSVYTDTVGMFCTLPFHFVPADEFKILSFEAGSNP